MVAQCNRKSKAHAFLGRHDLNTCIDKPVVLEYKVRQNPAEVHSRAKGIDLLLMISDVFHIAAELSNREARWGGFLCHNFRVVQGLLFFLRAEYCLKWLLAPWRFQCIGGSHNGVLWPRLVRPWHLEVQIMVCSVHEPCIHIRSTLRDVSGCFNKQEVPTWPECQKAARQDFMTHVCATAVWARFWNLQLAVLGIHRSASTPTRQFTANGTHSEHVKQVRKERIVWGRLWASKGAAPDTLRHRGAVPHIIPWLWGVQCIHPASLCRISHAVLHIPAHNGKRCYCSLAATWHDVT